MFLLTSAHRVEIQQEVGPLMSPRLLTSITGNTSFLWSPPPTSCDHLLLPVTTTYFLWSPPPSCDPLLPVITTSRGWVPRTRTSPQRGGGCVVRWSRTGRAPVGGNGRILQRKDDDHRRGEGIREREEMSEITMVTWKSLTHTWWKWWNSLRWFRNTLKWVGK